MSEIDDFCHSESIMISENTEGHMETEEQNASCKAPFIEQLQVNQIVNVDATNDENSGQSTLKNAQIFSLRNFKNTIQITGAWTDLTCSSLENNFTKGCKWAPDGTCILTNSDDNTLRIFNLPESLYSTTCWENPLETLPELHQAVSVKEGGTIYDYSWYPRMSSMEPHTCCVASCSRKSPVHLWDAFDGSLRATYNPLNQADEVEGAYSVAFSPDGTLLYCGFKNCIRVFKTSHPGCDFELRKLNDCKLMPCERQAGIVSCITVNPMVDKIYAVGSYLRTVGLYGEPNGSLLWLLKAQTGGVTHMQFSPDGTKLFTGGRKDPEILCWDLRYTNNVLASLTRQVNTNQRIYFDISQDGRYLSSGNSSGEVTVYDMLETPDKLESGPVLPLSASFTWQAHQDCTNGVSMHPTLPVVATSAGQRHISCDSDIEDEEEQCVENKLPESCLKLWWVGEQAEKTSESTTI